MRKVISIALLAAIALVVGVPIVGINQTAPITHSVAMDVVKMETTLAGKVSLGCIAAIVAITIAAFSLLGVGSLAAFLWWGVGLSGATFGVLASCGG